MCAGPAWWLRNSWSRPIWSIGSSAKARRRKMGATPLPQLERRSTLSLAAVLRGPSVIRPIAGCRVNDPKGVVIRALNLGGRYFPSASDNTGSERRGQHSDVLDVL